MDDILIPILEYLLDKPDGRYKIVKDGNHFLVIIPDENGEEIAKEYVKKEDDVEIRKNF